MIFFRPHRLDLSLYICSPLHILPITGLFFLWNISMLSVAIFAWGTFIKGVSEFLVIMEMLPCGVVAALLVLKVFPSSVPASHGVNMVTFQPSLHIPVVRSQRSTLLIPVNQSGDGASMVTRDTKGKSCETQTSSPVRCPVPAVLPPALNCFQTVLVVMICCLISFSSVVVLPEENERD